MSLSFYSCESGEISKSTTHSYGQRFQRWHWVTTVATSVAVKRGLIMSFFLVRSCNLGVSSFTRDRSNLLPSGSSAAVLQTKMLSSVFAFENRPIHDYISTSICTYTTTIFYFFSIGPLFMIRNCQASHVHNYQYCHPRVLMAILL